MEERKVPNPLDNVVEVPVLHTPQVQGFLKFRTNCQKLPAGSSSGVRPQAQNWAQHLSLRALASSGSLLFSAIFLPENLLFSFPGRHLNACKKQSLQFSKSSEIYIFFNGPFYRILQKDDVSIPWDFIHWLPVSFFFFFFLSIVDYNTVSPLLCSKVT